LGRLNTKALCNLLPGIEQISQDRHVITTYVAEQDSRATTMQGQDSTEFIAWIYGTIHKTYVARTFEIG
jgi:hypothetical protein